MKWVGLCVPTGSLEPGDLAEGMKWVGLCVPTGSLEPGDLAALGTLAETFGSGEVRLTVEQNVLIPNVPASRVDALLSEPIAQKFTPNVGTLVAGLVSCTGARWCPQAQIRTKENALDLARSLDAKQ